MGASLSVAPEIKEAQAMDNDAFSEDYQKPLKTVNEIVERFIANPLLMRRNLSYASAHPSARARDTILTKCRSLEVELSIQPGEKDAVPGRVIFACLCDEIYSRKSGAANGAKFAVVAAWKLPRPTAAAPAPAAGEKSRGTCVLRLPAGLKDAGDNTLVFIAPDASVQDALLLGRTGGGAVHAGSVGERAFGALSQGTRVLWASVSLQEEATAAVPPATAPLNPREGEAGDPAGNGNEASGSGGEGRGGAGGAQAGAGPSEEPPLKIKAALSAAVLSFAPTRQPPASDAADGDGALGLLSNGGGRPPKPQQEKVVPITLHLEPTQPKQQQQQQSGGKRGRGGARDDPPEASPSRPAAGDQDADAAPGARATRGSLKRVAESPQGAAADPPPPPGKKAKGGKRAKGGDAAADAGGAQVGENAAAPANGGAPPASPTPPQATAVATASATAAAGAQPAFAAEAVVSVVSAAAALPTPIVLSFRFAAASQRPRQGVSDMVRVLAGWPVDGSEVLVHFKYLRGHRTHSISTVGFVCPLCGLSCRSLTGLQHHLVATHIEFVFGFSALASALPCIEINPADGDSDKMLAAIEKEFKHIDPRFQRLALQREARLRALREQQQQEEEDVLPRRSRQATAPYGREAAAAGMGEGPSYRDGALRNKQRRRPEMAFRSLDHLLDSGRLFHARTALPVTKEELEEMSDSDDWDDNEHWVRKCKAQLDDIDDITESEKHFMFLWNRFVHSNTIFADALLPDALALFAVQRRAELAGSAPLRRCFTLHMITLWDYGLLSAADLDRALKLIDDPAVAAALDNGEPTGGRKARPGGPPAAAGGK